MSIIEDKNMQTHSCIEHIEIDTHLKSRYLDVSNYTSMKIIHEDGGYLWFPLWNLSGQLVGYQTYRPNSEKNVKKFSKDKHMYARYYTYVGKVNGVSHIAIFGIGKLDPKNGLNCYLAEGVFDAVVLHNLGLNCLAILGVGDKPNLKLKSLLFTMNYNFIAICQGDKAGLKLINYTNTHIKLPEGKDVSDLGTDIIKHILTLHKHLYVL